MLEQLIGELRVYWDWILTQLGWQGIQLSWVHILILALAFVGALLVLRNLLGGRSGGGGGSTTIYPPSRRYRDLPTRYYTGGEKLNDFSVPPEMYNFKVPTSTPDLSKLRGQANLDLDKARRLFIPPVIGQPFGVTREEKASVSSENESGGPLKDGERSVAANGSGTSQPAASSWGKPNWELARKLFIPRLRR